MTSGDPLLDVRDLTIRYRVRDRIVTAANGVSFYVNRGETLGIVGESGCGKSTIGYGLMRLLPPGTEVTGQVILDGENLLDLSPETMTRRRWAKIAMVFQSAMNALNPVLSVERQITEPMLQHRTVPNASAARDRARELFDFVGLPANRLSSYPHELSGGMRQRAVLAMSLACNPSILIADEPTTALDVVVQDQIFLRIQSLKERFGLTLALVSHDIGLIAETCDRVAVMYGGRLVEVGPARDVLQRSRHPYARALAQATPRLKAGSPLVSLPGSPPDLSQPQQGCIFAHRCPIVVPECRTIDPAPVRVQDDWSAACLFARDDTRPAVDAALVRIPPGPFLEDAGGVPRLSVQALTKTFRIAGTGLASLFGKGRTLTAVNQVDLSLAAGEAIALVGESGSGKTTLGMLIAGLESRSAGRVIVDGVEARGGSGLWERELRRKIQVVFQDPFESLNPRMTIGEILEEPLTIHDIGAPSERRGKVHELLERVGLAPGPSIAALLPRQLSGGQRQRVAIARAMILDPETIVADEPLSMLDTSVKAGILGLLGGFKSEGVSILMITHDLSVTRQICDRTAVMYLGSIVEIGPTAEIIDAPLHPYTQMLIGAVPDLDRQLDPARIISQAEPPDASDKPPGCSFHPRCPRATDICRTTSPPLVSDARHPVACWHPGPPEQHLLPADTSKEWRHYG